MGYAFVLAVALGALAIAAGVRHVLRIRELRRPPEITDDMIARLESGESLWLEHDEPLDLDEIREEEERFWESESWDEADEW